MNKKIVVFGSINVDIYNNTTVTPKGITLCPQSRPLRTLIFPGGKGANQAAVSAWLAEKRDLVDITTYLVGMVGNDEMGDWIIKMLQTQGVNTSRIEKAPAPTSIITLLEKHKDQKGKYGVSTGATAYFDKAVVDRNIDLIKKADLVMLQLEIPFETTKYIVEVCNKLGKKIMLNPDPKMDKFNKELFSKVDIITPNAHEMTKEQAFELTKLGVTVIQTKGKHGAHWYQPNGEIKEYQPIKYKVVSTIGAGDTFSGTLGYYLLRDYPMGLAIKRAIENSSWSVRQLGAFRKEGEEW